MVTANKSHSRLKESDHEGTATTTAKNKAEHVFMPGDAKVLTRNGLPDMRFMENREAFLFEKDNTIGGKPDLRKKSNRPDIRELHEERGDDRPNVTFNTDGELK